MTEDYTTGAGRVRPDSVGAPGVAAGTGGYTASMPVDEARGHSSTGPEGQK